MEGREARIVKQRKALRWKIRRHGNLASEFERKYVQARLKTFKIQS